MRAEVGAGTVETRADGRGMDALLGGDLGGVQTSQEGVDAGAERRWEGVEARAQEGDQVALLNVDVGFGVRLDPVEELDRHELERVFSPPLVVRAEEILANPRYIAPCPRWIDVGEGVSDSGQRFLSQVLRILGIEPPSEEPDEDRPQGREQRVKRPWLTLLRSAGLGDKVCVVGPPVPSRSRGRRRARL